MDLGGTPHPFKKNSIAGNVFWHLMIHLLRKQRLAFRPTLEQPAAIQLHLVGEQQAKSPENSPNTWTVRCSGPNRCSAWTVLPSLLGEKMLVPTRDRDRWGEGKIHEFSPSLTKVDRPFKIKYHQWKLCQNSSPTYGFPFSFLLVTHFVGNWLWCIVQDTSGSAASEEKIVNWFY